MAAHRAALDRPRRFQPETYVMKRLSLPLALGVFAVLAISAPPSTTLAQATAGTSCIRRHVPDPSTLTSITQTYNFSQINSISAGEYQSLSTGPDIPDSS